MLNLIKNKIHKFSVMKNKYLLTIDDVVSFPFFVAPTDFECNQIRSRYDLYLKILMILAHKFSNVFNALLRYFTKSNDSTIDEFYTYCVENNLIK